jgi:pyruvate formate lyase activating enzyme
LFSDTPGFGRRSNCGFRSEVRETKDQEGCNGPWTTDHGHEMLNMSGIKGFLEASFVEWRGKICAVLFLSGCNFRCPFCHNHRLVLCPEALEDISLEMVLKRLGSLRGWLDGVCITGGEPTLHSRLGTMVREIRAMGLLVKLDTNGSRPEVLEALDHRGLLEAVSMDVKAPLDQRKYSLCAGRPVPLGKIRRSIEILDGADLELEFRTTVVPGLLEEEDIQQIARVLPPRADYRVQGFRAQDALDPSFRRLTPYSEEFLERIREGVAQIRASLQEAVQPLSTVVPCKDLLAVRIGTPG